MPTSAVACVTEAPAQLGYRWPAEWQPHAATWLSWPHNQETWPGRLAAAERAFVAMVAALVPHEAVHISVLDPAMEERVRRLLSAQGVDADRGVRFFRFPTDDAWVRDCGPVFVVRDDESAVVDFGFDAWGGKYPPWDRDAALPRRVAEALGLRRFECNFVLEAGSIDGDGAGTLLTTETCLLNPNRGGDRTQGADRTRGGDRTRERVETWLAQTLAARRVLWLDGAGIAGDDTDGHIDNLARFVCPGTVVAAANPGASHGHADPLAENLRRLRSLRDAHDKPIDVIPLPVPPPLVAGGQRLPASYVNFYLANGVALVPVFGVATDERALAVLRECLPGREIAAIPCVDLVVGLGAVHCLTQQQPAESTLSGSHQASSSNGSKRPLSLAFM